MSDLVPISTFHATASVSVCDPWRCLGVLGVLVLIILLFASLAAFAVRLFSSLVSFVSFAVKLWRNDSRTLDIQQRH